MFYHFESLGAKVIILLIVMAKQTAFLHKKTAMCHAAAVLPVCMTFANYKITHIYIICIFPCGTILTADRSPVKNKEKRMAKSGSENTGSATNFSGCPPCKKHTWLIVKNTSHVF